MAAIISEHTNLPKSTTSTTFPCRFLQESIQTSRRQKGTVGSRHSFVGRKTQAVTDIQLAFSSGDRRLGMARMLERLCGALEVELRKLTQKDQRVPCVCGGFNVVLV